MATLLHPKYLHLSPQLCVIFFNISVITITFFWLQVWNLVELMFLMRFRRLWEFLSFWEINLVEPFQFSKWPILTEWIPALFLSTLFPGLPVTKYDNTLFSSLSHKMVITVVIYIPPDYNTDLIYCNNQTHKFENWLLT